MHVELAAIAVLVVIVVTVIIRIARVNTIERSISGHRRRLHSMEEVVHRSRERRGELVTRPLRELRELPPERPKVPAARIDLSDDPRHHVSEEGRLVFGDLSITPVRPPVPPVYPSRAERRQSKGEASRRTRNLVFVLGPLVVLAGAGAGGYAYWSSRHQGSSSRSKATVPPSTAPARRPVTDHHRSKAKAQVPPRRRPGRSRAPLTVLSSSATSATVLAPAGTYHVVVNASAPCWVGFERTESASGPWLADATIGTGSATSASFSVSGPLVVAIGAPRAVSSIEVNGVAIQLTSLPPEAYDLFLTTTAH